MPKRWRPLQAGDQVQIIAPSSKTLEKPPAWEKVQQLLIHWQLVPRISAYIFGEATGLPELANTDAQRFADLQTAILDPQIKAIWCLRGGYGAIRLLPYLEHAFPKPPRPKLFIGFSDITILHHYFQQRWRWSTVHGPGALQVAEQRVAEADIILLRQLMFGQCAEITLNDLIPLNKSARQRRSISSALSGGNLTLLSRTLGTPYAPRWKNKILVVEDINEPFRKIDGILQQFTLAGYWRAAHKPGAIILGDFTVNQPLQQQQVDTALQQFAMQLDDYNIPVLRCFNIGHGVRNHPLPLATKAILKLGKKPLLQAEAGYRL